MASASIMMGNLDAKSKCALGFLTVVEHPEHGLCGGYLVLNRSGRPLEFHCTTPVRPNRAQEILYGATLKPFLFGEQIGQALLSKSKLTPLVICTDQEPALAVADYSEVPVALVVASGTLPGARRIDAPHASIATMHRIPVGSAELALAGAAPDACARLAERLVAELGQGFDFAEPFARIREAIEEAQRALR